MPAKWLWRHLVAFGHVTLFAAPGKTGKGNVTIDPAARMTEGLTMPGGKETRAPHERDHRRTRG